jgi:hypothetical protein
MMGRLEPYSYASAHDLVSDGLDVGSFWLGWLRILITVCTRITIFWKKLVGGAHLLSILQSVNEDVFVIDRLQ